MKHISSRLWAIMLLVVSFVLPSAAWADGSHRLTVVAKPTMAGSFNTNSVDLVAGETIHLYAYSNGSFDFVHWIDHTGAVVSEQTDFTYIMPARDVTLTAEYVYNPANPANPASNYWDKQHGELIIDDFTSGSLYSAIYNALGDSNESDVTMLTVAGVINSNDFGVANYFSNCSVLDLSRVTGVTEVPSYAFDYAGYEMVKLPSSIEKIGYYAFGECSKLLTLTIYAMTPPVLEDDVFYNVPDGLVVYVPAAAIAQYQDSDDWSKFTLLPIQEDIRSISVSLPQSAKASDYAKMWLELTNTKSGQRMHYIMTERDVYTFANIIKNTSWNVVLRNERGDVFGKIDNVEVKDEDVSVSFASLKKPQTISLAVQTPDGKDVTGQTQITWTDGSGNYIAQGTSLSALPVGYQLNYSVALSQDLAMLYGAPKLTAYTLKDSGNSLTCKLENIKQVQITGKVKDVSTGMALSGAVVSASQTFGGKYSKTINGKTDANGVFALTVANVPTSLAFAATDYISQSVNLGNELNELNELADVLLKPISGATITVGFNYTTVDGETQDWYSDYQNVGYTLYNKTRKKAINQFNVQYPQIVLLEEVSEGDVLELTAESKTQTFKPVKATATITANQTAEAQFSIVELGQLKAEYSQSGNVDVVASLYDASGKLVKTYNYRDMSLTISNLADGKYTLVSMGSSQFFNSIYDLAQLPQSGLKAGTDYVQNAVTVKSGKVTTVNIDLVPKLDESKLYYTGDNTSFTVNKPNIVAGNYLTLTGHISFKPAYETGVSNVQMIVDLPEACEFVENSVMVGNSTSSYTLNGRQLTIPMARYSDRVRFCIIPTAGGEYAPSAFAQFKLNGKSIKQPIGSANYTAKDLSISVPSTVDKTSIPVSGTAIGTSTVEIYDNDILIGQTTSLANGTWSTTSELNNPYNLSTHNIYAKVTTKAGMELISETKQVVYDKNMVVPEKVTMLYYNPEYVGQYNIVFDFIKRTVSPKSYYFFPYKSYPDWWDSGTEPKEFTFVADLSNNDSTAVNGVTIRVYTDNGYWRNLEAQYNTSMNRWVAVSQFVEEEAPVGVEVEIDANIHYYIDANVLEKGFEGTKDLQEIIESSTSLTNELASKITNLLDSNEYSKEEVNSLMEELLGTINFNETISLNDKSVSDLLKETESLLSTDFTGLFSINYNDFEEISNYLDGFSIETRDDLNEELLVNEGFQKINCTDGKEYFYKYTDNEYIIAYLPLSIYIVYNLQNIENEASLSRTRQANDVTDLTTWRGKVYLLCDKLNTVVSAVTNAVDGVINHVDALKGKCQVQISENLGKLLQNAEEPFLTQKEINGLTKANVKLSKQIKQCEAISNWLSKNLKNFRVSNGAGVAFSLFDVFSITQGIKDDGNEIINLYFSVPDCPKDTNDDNLRNRIRNWGIGCFMFYAGKLAADIVQINSVVVGVTGAVPTGGTSLSAVGIALGIAAASFAAELAYSWQFDKNKERFENEISRLKCKDDDKCPRCGKNPCECPDKCPRCGNKPCTCPKKCPRCGSNPCVCPPPTNTTEVQHDPSGYVYEGVASNRLQGVMASCYYKETVEDMYGDLHENVVLWDAEEYAQENPLFTDEDGMYRWDVPKGLWQVKFEKEGYETTYSEWLPVPPPQLDINIAMTQNRQPEVKSARAFQGAVELEFDKYMQPELLTTENITVMSGNKAVEGTIKLLNEEVAYEGETETFASKVRFNAAKPFDGKEVTLMVSNRVKSYAGIRMQDDFSQQFTVEEEVSRIDCKEGINVVYGQNATISVTALPASASAGKTLRVKSSSAMILSTDAESLVLDKDGKAEIKVHGELPGTAALTFSVDGYDLTTTKTVNVVTIIKGDVNGDGEVNAADIVILQNYLSDQQTTGIDESAADADGDGSITAADIPAIVAIILNKR